MIDSEDVQLFQSVDDPATALRILQAQLVPELDESAPSLAHTRTEEGA